MKIMNSKKGVRVLVTLVIVSILAISLVSAGFWDLFKKDGGEGLEGELEVAKPADVSITMANSLPFIESWTEPDWDTTVGGINPWTPTACNSPSATRVMRDAINNREGAVVTISDANSDSDLDTTAAVTMTVTKGAVTHTATCTLIAATIDGDNYADFSCYFDMDFYDLEGSDWSILVTATDDIGDSASNNNVPSDGGASYPFFTYGSLLDIDIDDSDLPSTDTIKFGGIAADSANVEASNYIITNNCGNRGVSATGINYITVKGLDLANPGSTDFMEPDTFSVDDLSILHNLDPNGACNDGAYTGAQLLDNDAVVASIVTTNVLDATLAIGDSITPSPERDLYFCLEDINPSTYRGNDPITVDSYSTMNAGVNWEINAVE
jgi:hypothetical protein